MMLIITHLYVFEATLFPEKIVFVLNEMVHVLVLENVMIYSSRPASMAEHGALKRGIFPINPIPHSPWD